jgi:hypothetical protein
MATLERGRDGVVGRAADGEPLQGGEVEEMVMRVGLGLGFVFSESPPWLGLEMEGPSGGGWPGDGGGLRGDEQNGVLRRPE